MYRRQWRVSKSGNIMTTQYSVQSSHNNRQNNQQQQSSQQSGFLNSEQDRNQKKEQDSSFDRDESDKELDDIQNDTVYQAFKQFHLQRELESKNQRQAAPAGFQTSNPDYSEGNQFKLIDAQPESKSVSGTGSGDKGSGKGVFESEATKGDVASPVTHKKKVNGNIALSSAYQQSPTPKKATFVSKGVHNTRVNHDFYVAQTLQQYGAAKSESRASGEFRGARSIKNRKDSRYSIKNYQNMGNIQSQFGTIQSRNNSVVQAHNQSTSNDEMNYRHQESPKIIIPESLTHQLDSHHHAALRASSSSDLRGSYQWNKNDSGEWQQNIYSEKKQHYLGNGAPETNDNGPLITVSKFLNDNQEEQDIGDQTIEYSKLITHIHKKHPNQNGRSFKACESVGRYRCCCFLGSNPQTTALAAHLGLGPSLFLLSTKAFIVFFICLTVLGSLPMGLLLWGYGKERTDTLDTFNWVSALSFGNIGNAHSACALNDLALQVQNQEGFASDFTMEMVQDVNLTLACQTHSTHLSQVLISGLTQNAQQSCADLPLNDNESLKKQLLPECQGQYEQATNHPDFDNFFTKNCKGFSGCQIPLKYLFPSIKCQNFLYNQVYRRFNYQVVSQLNQLYESKIVIIAKCRTSDPVLGILGETTPSHLDSSLVIVAIDFLMVLSLMVFIYWLDKNQTLFSKTYKQKLNQISNYALRLGNMPSRKHYSGSQNIMRIYLWYIIHRILESQKKQDDNQSETREENGQNNPISQYSHLDIMDISFGVQDSPTTEKLCEISQIRIEIELEKKRISKLKQKDLINKFKGEGENQSHENEENQEEDNCKFSKNLEKLEVKYEKLKEEYLNMIGLSKNQNKWLAPANKKRNVQSNNTFRLIEQSQNMLNLKIEYAFILFRSVRGLDIVKEAYSVSAPQRFFFRCFSCYFKNQNNQLNQRLLHHTWPSHRPAKPPQNIHWQNMGVSQLYRVTLQIISWLIILVLVAVTIAVALLVQRWSGEVVGFRVVQQCPRVDLIQMHDAYLDHLLPVPSQRGLMHCFCQNKLQQGADLAQIKFGQIIGLESREQSQKDPICLKWHQNYMMHRYFQFLIPLLLVVLNQTNSFIICKCIKFLRLPTKNDEATILFQMMTTVQFLSILIFLLIASENGFISLLWFSDRDQTSGEIKPLWIHAHGSQLVYILLFYILIPQLIHLFQVLQLHLSRCLDRGGCFRSLRKDFTGEVNTKKLILYDLQNLYTGSQIEESKLYAQLFTVIMLTTVFGSVIILLNGAAMIYILVLYVINKALFVKHHQKSHVFNEDIPVLSISFFKLALVLRLAVTFLVFTEADKLNIEQNKLLNDLRSSFLAIPFDYLVNQIDQNSSKDIDNMTNEQTYPRRFSTNVSFAYLLLIQILVIIWLLKTIFSFTKSIMQSILNKTRMKQTRASAKIRSAGDTPSKDLDSKIHPQSQSPHLPQQIPQVETSTLNAVDSSQQYIENYSQHNIQQTMDDFQAGLGQQSPQEGGGCGQESRNDRQTDLLLAMNISGLRNLYKRSLQELSEAESSDVKLIVEAEILNSVIKLFKHRIASIEQVIDSHISDLIDLNEQSKERTPNILDVSERTHSLKRGAIYINDQETDITTLPYPMKLTLLHSNEGSLIMRARQQGQEMGQSGHNEGLSHNFMSLDSELQSYNMSDSYRNKIIQSTIHQIVEKMD